MKGGYQGEHGVVEEIGHIWGVLAKLWLHGASDKSTHPYPRIVFWLILGRGGKSAATIFVLVFACFVLFVCFLSVFVCFVCF